MKSRFILFALFISNSVFSQMSIVSVFKVSGLPSTHVCHDNAGNIYVAGYTRGSTFSGDDTLTHVFKIRKYAASGTFIWERQLTGHHLEVYNVCIKNDIIYVGGCFKDTLHNYGNYYPSHGGYDLFLYRLFPNGSSSANTQGGTGDEHAQGFVVDDNHDLYFSGTFQGNVQVGSFMYSSQNEDLFFIKSDQNLSTIKWHITGLSINPGSAFLYNLRIFNSKLYTKSLGKAVLNTSDTIGGEIWETNGDEWKLNGVHLRKTLEQSYVGTHQVILTIDKQNRFYYEDCWKSGCAIFCNDSNENRLSWPYPEADFIKLTDNLVVFSDDKARVYFNDYRIVLNNGNRNYRNITDTLCISYTQHHTYLKYLNDYKYDQVLVGGYFFGSVNVGSHQLTADSANSYDEFFAIINVDNTVGVHESSTHADFEIYPNPNAGEFEIRFAEPSDSNVLVQIQDLSGKIIRSSIIDHNGRYNVDLSDQSPGLYLALVSRCGVTTASKIIVK
jgi:hypothetical protein